MASLGHSGARGAIVGVSGQVAKLGINLVSLVVLARFLSPRDYGLVAMVMAIIGVAELIKDMGLSTASVQAKTLSKQQQSNLWWVNTALGLLCTLVAVALAPVLSWLYQEPTVIQITLVMSSIFLISGAATQYRTDLIRKLQMGRIASIDLTAGIISLAVAFVLAVNGAGFWALISQQLISNIFTLIFLGLWAGWLPKKYDRSVSVKPFFSFGIPVFGSSILTYAAGNLDAVLVGRFFGTGELGFYNRGMQLIRLPMNQIRGPLGSVALSTLSKVQDDDDRFRNLVTKAQSVFLYPVTLIGFLIAITADELIPLLLGEKWLAIIPFVVIFAVGDAISNLSSAGSWIYLSKGKSGALFKYTILSAVVRIVLFVIMLPWGLHAVASVYAIAPLFLWPLSLFICAKATGFNTMPLYLNSLRILLVAASSALFAWSTVNLLHLNNTIALLVLHTVIYALALGLLTLIPRVRKDYLELINTFKGIIKR
ncbi:lipopolysaccharide biosynthesis protein [Rothia sp. ZJ1223]|uniref:lipopolysaccharide biosynthesis protein n=1 Tax=Rothia sp. ZJ1223 TaxID=2811098 RepID=UPI001958B92D|nr:lipopolysaccharide biosynthesis protein [Rothia sp. ZJ1223]